MDFVSFFACFTTRMFMTHFAAGAAIGGTIALWRQEAYYRLMRLPETNREIDEIRKSADETRDAIRSARRRDDE